MPAAMRSLPDILYNFHWVVPGEAARSAQAYAGFLAPFLKARDIRAIVNLRGAHPERGWWRYENRVCEKLGVVQLNPKLNSRRLPTRQILIDLIAAFDAAPTPLLIKCSGGQDRSSFASALYIVHRKGWSAFDEANAQFAAWPYLHRPKAQQRWLKPFLEFVREAAHGRPLAEWIASDYTPQSLKAWLEARGLGGAFRGLYDKPGPG
jgi:hypothetical protein